MNEEICGLLDCPFAGAGKMEVIEITLDEWNRLNMSEDTYFANGCLFDEKTDNLVAFAHYEDQFHEAGKWYKIIKL